MIKYLENDEKKSTIALYKEAFYEDSEQFIDYYYKYKVQDNRILADMENGIRAMLHLNPYRMMLKCREYEIFYIVAVATAIEHRRKGYMAGLLKRSMEDMYNENIPFTFLLPANEKYYLPFDFRYISNYRNPLEANIPFKKESFVYSKHAKEVLAFWKKSLSAEFDVYCIRDTGYLDRLIKELDTEKGNIDIYLDDRLNIVGTEIFWGIEKKESREIIFNKSSLDIAFSDKPYMMGRIINIHEFMKNISIKRDSDINELSLILNLKDELIEKNNMKFLWMINKEGSILEEIKDFDIIDRGNLDLDISELTEYLFSYKKNYKYEIFKHIECLKGVFINEVV